MKKTNLILILTMILLSTFTMASLIYEDDFCGASSSLSADWTTPACAGGSTNIQVINGLALQNWSNSPCTNNAHHWYIEKGAEQDNFTFGAILKHLTAGTTPCTSYNVWFTNSSDDYSYTNLNYGIIFRLNGTLELQSNAHPNTEGSGGNLLVNCGSWSAVTKRLDVKFSRDKTLSLTNITIYIDEEQRCNYYNDTTDGDFSINTVGFNQGTGLALPNNCSMGVDTFYMRDDLYPFYDTTRETNCFTINIYNSIGISTGSPICINENITYSFDYTGGLKNIMRVDCYGEGSNVITSDLEFNPEITCNMNRTRSYTAKIYLATEGQNILQAEMFTNLGEVLNDTYPDCYETNQGATTINIIQPDVTVPTAISIDDTFESLISSFGISDTSTKIFLSILILVLMVIGMLKYTDNYLVIVFVIIVVTVLLSLMDMLPKWLIVLFILLASGVGMIFGRDVLFGKGSEK